MHTYIDTSSYLAPAALVFQRRLDSFGCLGLSVSRLWPWYLKQGLTASGVLVSLVNLTPWYTLGAGPGQKQPWAASRLNFAVIIPFHLFSSK